MHYDEIRKIRINKIIWRPRKPYATSKKIVKLNKIMAFTNKLYH